TIPIGYGDGYNRLLSNRGRVIVLAHGKSYFAPVIGRVCMDQIMVDITDVPAKLGDKVIAMGTADDKSVDADEIARICETISYEILLSYTSRVPRVYVGE
ncbi:MAG: alanine racemase C-terminal domain-containing protein, partial [Eubacteriales bacterium]